MNSCTYYWQYGLQIMDNNFCGNMCISSQEFTGMLKLVYFWILKLFLHGCYVQKSWNKHPKTENYRIGIFYPLSFPDFDILAWGSMGKCLLTCCKCLPWTVVKPDPSRQFGLEVDMSQIRMGAILYQCDPPTKQADGTEKLRPWWPVGFHFQKFTTTEQNYPIYNHEFLVIICGLWC